MYRFAIKKLAWPGEGGCPLCGQEVEWDVGPEVCLEEGHAPVCWHCAGADAPEMLWMVEAWRVGLLGSAPRPAQSPAPRL